MFCGGYTEVESVAVNVAPGNTALVTPPSADWTIIVVSMAMRLTGGGTWTLYDGNPGTTGVAMTGNNSNDVDEANDFGLLRRTLRGNQLWVVVATGNLNGFLGFRLRLER